MPHIISMDKITVPPNIEGLIFDCDGTIADTMPLHFKAYQDALGPASPFFTIEMFYHMAGVPAVKILELLKRQHSLDYDAETVAAEKEKYFGEMLHKVTSIAAVEQVIHHYHGVLPMVIASGGTRENILRTIQVIGLATCFDAIVSADEVPNGKPAPDIFLQAAKLINIDPAKCLVFEDADMGIKAAQSAGMQYIDVRTFT